MTEYQLSWDVIEVNTMAGVMEVPAVVLGPCALTWDWTRSVLTISHLATGFKMGLRIYDVEHGLRYLNVLCDADPGIWSSDLQVAVASVKKRLLETNMFNHITGTPADRTHPSDVAVMPVNLARLEARS